MLMNEQQHQSTSKPAGLSVSLSALSIFGLIASFLLVVFIMIALNRPAPVDDSLSDKRDKTLAEVQNWHKELLSTYGWVDQSGGIVRVPIDRAMELTIKELSGRESSLQKSSESVGEALASTTEQSLATGL